MKVLYLSTPEFGVQPLEALVASPHEVVGVVTQPDRPSGRGKKLNASPVKLKAQELGLKVYQFDRIRNETEVLRGLGADCFLTAAYGQILSQEVLDIPRYGVINIHASLLPKYRGSAPVPRAIENGDEVIGVTFMRTALKVDSGDMIRKISARFTEENSEEVLSALSAMAAEEVSDVLTSIEDGTAVYQPQTESEATWQPMIKKEDGAIDFSFTPKKLVDFVRAMNPWPSAYFTSKYGRIKVLRAQVSDLTPTGEVGTVVSADKRGLFVNVSDGVVRLSVVQAEGSKAMPDTAFLAGRKFFEGEKLIGE